MRKATALMLLFCSGCLGQIIPQHAGTSDPVPMDDATPAPAPDPTPAATGDVANKTPLDGGVASLPSETLSIEAESAALTAPMSTATDGNAYAGQFISTPAAATGGKAVFTFDVPRTTSYAVWGRIIAPTDAANSFHLSVDSDTIDNDATDGVSTIWDLPITTSWTWVRLNMRIAAGNSDLTESLTAGTHTLYLNEREALSQLDRIVITSDLSYIPN